MEEIVLKVAPIFSDNMVLQREKNVSVWGTGKDNSTVTVTIAGHSDHITVRENKWCVSLPSMKAGGPYTLEVTDQNTTITYENVMIGEVWLAGGQSNMELELQNSLHGKDEVAAANYDNIRFYNTLRLTYINEDGLKEEENNHWKVCSPDTVGVMSAVGYYYAKQLAQELHVTVGLIGCNYGGTSATAWISRETLELDKDTNNYLIEYNKANENRTLKEYDKLLTDYVIEYDRWKTIADGLYSKRPDILWEEVNDIAGQCPYPEPLGPKSPYRPAGLYETMLQRIMPYTLKGFIYYQGESDDNNPTIYDKLLTILIEQWRKDWCDYELPFLFVQLPMYKARSDKDTKHWAIIREHQMKVHKTIKNTGLAVILDCGEFDNIHPLNKKTVGDRLALQAYYHVYHKEVKAYGPIYQSMNTNGNVVKLTFQHAEGGLVSKHDIIIGFEIAGEEKEYVEATAKIAGDSIVVSSESVSEPRYVRYNWTNYGEVSLFNKAGLPMAAFSTGDHFI